ncbi:MAG: alpha/beta fold hydrolase [Acidimicrobiales bacterium]
MSEPALSPTFFEVPVAGGDLHVARFGSGPRIVLGLHGITGSAMQLVPVVRHLGPQFTLIAPDLRGRGGSNHLPPPFGMQAHAADCAAVLRQLPAGPVVVLGESMGAYVAVVMAAMFPELVERLVLADGGLPLPLSPDVDPDVVLEAVLGPALARLSRVFESREAYLDFWRAHPAFGEQWTADVEAYIEYDLEPVAGGFRSRSHEDAVRVDGRQHIVDPSVIEDSLRALRCPVALLRAPRNLVNQPSPLLADDVVTRWRESVADFSDQIVPDTNHYTLMLGERGAKLIADRIVGAPPSEPGSGSATPSPP